MVKYELNSKDLMSASEASVRWGYDEGYVRQQLSKYPEKFKEGTIRKFGKTYIITREGMEHLTGMSEKEANSGLWLVRHEVNWIVDFEQRVDSELDAKNLIVQKIAEETKEKDFKFRFEELDVKSKKSCVRLKGNSIYTYEKTKK